MSLKLICAPWIHRSIIGSKWDKELERSSGGKSRVYVEERALCWQSARLEGV